MVTIGIIVLLVAILLPVASVVRKRAYAVVCLGNQRQLMAAIHLYAFSNNDVMPYNGWSNGPVANWLYNSGLPAAGPPFAQSEVKTGRLWPYLKDVRLFRCAVDDGPWLTTSIQSMSSYIMNGAVNGYGRNGTKPNRLHIFKGDDVILWELPLYSVSGISVNDPSNYPPEGVTSRHNKATSVGCIDGHAELMQDSEFNSLCQSGPTRLWCEPNAGDGGVNRWPYGTIPNPISMLP